MKSLRIKIAYVLKKKKKVRRGWESQRQLRAVSWTATLHRSLEQDSEEISNEETKQKME